MATTTQDLVLIATAIAITALTVLKYIGRRRLEGKALSWLDRFGNHEYEMEDCLEQGAPSGGEGPDGQVRGWRREPRGLRSKLAFVLADEAYLQFGRRERSQANDLVTRKFLRDLCRERKGLRAKDMSAAIEVALALSYVPPQEMFEVEAYRSTAAYRSVVPDTKPKYH